MSNNILTTQMITNEALAILVNNLSFTRKCDKQVFSSSFGKAGNKIGQTLQIRKPARFTVRSGSAMSIQDYQEQYANLTLNPIYGVDIAVDDRDFNLSLDEFGSRIIEPAVATLANKIDYDGLTTLTPLVAQSVGTPGTTPNALSTFTAAMQKLDEAGAPKGGERCVIINPACQASMVQALSGLYTPTQELGKQFMTGNLGQLSGLSAYMSQNVLTRTSGALGGTPLVNGASQTGSSLVTNGWTASAAQRLNVGDVFTIAGVYATNPMSYQSTGALKQFTVTAAGSSDGSGNMTIAFTPAIVASGAQQNVTASPASGAALSFASAASTVSVQNLAFHPNAFAFGCVELDVPNGLDKTGNYKSFQGGNVEGAVATSTLNGVSIRYLRGYDMTNGRYLARFDVLYGWAAVYPELACRIQG